jgi:rubrerythrin
VKEKSRRERYAYEAKKQARELGGEQGIEPCEKRTHRTKQQAQLALLLVRSERRQQARVGLRVGKGSERSVYRCPKCGYWHLTSQAKDLRPKIPGRGWNGKW